ncbi:MAG: hypothetical protein AABW84_02190 [Nanoarchaeota archaeon]
MKILVNDIERINKELEAKGGLKNEGSLHFAVSHAIHTKDWRLQLAYLLRALLVDHVFNDGNKRTAAYLITLYFDEHNINYDKDKLARLIIKIASKNIIKIDEIRRLIKDETI